MNKFKIGDVLLYKNNKRSKIIIKGYHKDRYSISYIHIPGSSIKRTYKMHKNYLEENYEISLSIKLSKL